MKTYVVETDDFAWASSIAGTVKSLIDGGLKISLSFKSGNPLILKYNSYFSAGGERTTVKLPATEEDYHKLDTLYRNSIVQRLKDSQGVLVDLPVQALSINVLASVLFKEITGREGSSKPWVWRVSSKANPYAGIHGIYSGREAQCLAFCRGLGISNPVVRSIESIPKEDWVEALYNPSISCVLLPTKHPMLFALMPQYKGYDSLGNCTPVVCTFTNNEEFDRKNLIWPAVWPMPVDWPVDRFEERGTNWAIRQSYGHNVQNFLKARALSKVA